ncbi:MAG: hypothetical protein WCF27_03545 [Gaiellaceae bacterium]
MKRGLILLALCLLIVLTAAASAAPAEQGPPAKQADPCSWGASSIVVEEVDGQLVQSEPSTTGCIP